MSRQAAVSRAQEVVTWAAASRWAVRVGATRGALPVVAFHGVASSRRFATLLSALLVDFEPIDPADWDPADRDLAERRTRKKRVPIVLTFDDAHGTVVENGLPVLLDRGVRATMFVCPGIATGSRQFWWDLARRADAAGLRDTVAPDADTDLARWLKRQPDRVRRDVVARCADLLEDASPQQAAPVEYLERWLSAGMQLGNHTWDHPCLDRCSTDEQTEQIVRAHDWLTRFCGRPPATFAYPNGDWTAHAETVLAQLGYRSGFLFDHRTHRRSDHPLRVSRLRLDADASPRRGRAIASGWHPTAMHAMHAMHAVQACRAPAPGPDVPPVVASARRGADVTMTVLEWDERGHVARDWDALAALPGASAFQTRSWVEAWRETMARSCRVRLIVATDTSTGAVAGLLPLAELSRRVHRRIPVTLGFVGIAGSGSGGADHLGPLATDEQVGARLLQHAVDLEPRRSLYLENLTAHWHRAALAATHGTVTRVTECPRQTRVAPSGFDDAWSTKSRKNDRRRQRQLSAAGIAPHWVAAGPGFEDALTCLQRLHRQRWATEGTGGLLDDERLAFIKAFAARCTEPDAPRILQLVHETGPVAALLGFVHGDSFSVYKTGWDPRFAKLGLGTALGSEAMRWAQQQGLTTFDYLRGARAHKVELGCRPAFDYSVLRPRGLSGQALRLREQFSGRRSAPARR